MSAATEAIQGLLDRSRRDEGRLVSVSYENGRRDGLRAALTNVKLAERAEHASLRAKAARFDLQVREEAEKHRIQGGT